MCQFRAHIWSETGFGMLYHAEYLEGTPVPELQCCHWTTIEFTIGCQSKQSIAYTRYSTL